MSGVSQFLSEFEDPKDTPPATKGETREQRHARKANERSERSKATLEERKAAWDPHSDPNAADTDAFKTLFVGRLHYAVTAEQVEKEFDVYGPIKSCKLVYDKEGKPRGIAFIEFEHESDMHVAFKRGDGKKIEGKRVVVDVERGRTVKNWLPRRLGGGLGATRKGAPNECVKISGRYDPTQQRPPDDGYRPRDDGGSSYRGGYGGDRGDSRGDRRNSYDNRDRDRRGSYDDRGRRGGYDRDRDVDRRDRDRGGYDRGGRGGYDDHRDRDRSRRY